MTTHQLSSLTLAVVEKLAADRPPVEAVVGLADYYDEVTRNALAEAESRLGSPPHP